MRIRFPISTCVFLALSLCSFAHGNEQGVGRRSQTPEADAQDGRVGADRWPFLATVHLVVLPDNARDKGIDVADIVTSVEDTLKQMSVEAKVKGKKESTLDALETAVVKGRHGTKVRLSEVARLDVSLVHKDALAGNIAGATRPPSVLSGPREDYGPARIDVHVDERTLTAKGVTMADVNKAIASLARNREYSLDDIRSLRIPARGRTFVRLAEVATVTVLFNNSVPPARGSGFSNRPEAMAEPYPGSAKDTRE